MTAAAKAEEDISPIVLEILMTAVNTARYKQVTKAADLRQRLEQMYPDNKADIDKALSFWAKRIRETGAT